MKWIRITMKGKAFAHPPMCPNCLDEPATTPVRIVRDALMPGFIVSYEGNWPHCESCAIYYTERSRHFSRGIALDIAGGAFLAIGVSFSTFRQSTSTTFFIWLALWTMLSALLVWRYRVCLRRTPSRKPRCTAGFAVKPLRGSRQFLSSDLVMDLLVAHPVYAKALIDANRETAEIRYDEIRLTQSLQEYRLDSREPQGNR